MIQRLHIVRICAVTILAAQCVRPALAGNLDSPYGLNVHTPATPIEFAMLEQVAAAGVDWVRIDMNWNRAQPNPGAFQWDVFDNFTAKAEELGINVFASIKGGVPAWAAEFPTAGQGDPGYGVMRDPSEWYTYVDEAVRRYAGKIDHWGIWNEPDYVNFWYGSRQQFIDEVFIPSADIIKAANPQAKLVGPGLSMLAANQPTGPWFDWLADIMTQAGDKIDIFDFHIYRDSRAEYNFRIEWDGDLSLLYGEPPGTIISTTQSIRANLDVFGWDGPVWITESGWDYEPTDPDFAATRLTETLEDWFTGDPDRSWVDKFFYFHMWDGPGGQGEGLFHADGTPRETYHAYADFMAAHPVPEPSTLVLLLSGGAMALATSVGRRRCKSLR